MKCLWSSHENTEEELDKLRKQLDSGNGERIIAFADTRYWHGGHCGYRWVEMGNLRDCFFTNHRNTEFYLTDGGELMSREYDREGTCQYYFRRMKPNVPRNFLTMMMEARQKGIFGNTFIRAHTNPLGHEVMGCLKEELL